MCSKTPAPCPEHDSILVWLLPGTAICQAEEHSVWLPSLPVPPGHRFVMGEGAAVAFQEDCESCTWPAVEHAFLPDPDTMPSVLPGTVWMKARDLKPGMRLHMGFGYSLTVTSVNTPPTQAGSVDRTYFTAAPPARCGNPMAFNAFADSPECVEGDR